MDNGSSAAMRPHAEHILLLGNQRLAVTGCAPYHQPGGGLMQPVLPHVRDACVQTGEPQGRLCAGCGCLAASGCAPGKVFAAFPDGQQALSGRAAFFSWRASPPCSPPGQCPLPLGSRGQLRAFTHPITDKRTRLPSNLKVPGPLSKRAESRLPFFLNFG
jgi:hypothetical protein